MCTQVAIDRAVTVERELHRLQQKLKEADRRNAELVCQLKSSQADTLQATSNLKSTSLSLSVLQKNNNAAVLLLNKHVEDGIPSVSVQAFAHRVLQKCSTKEHSQLKTKKAGRSICYKRVAQSRSLKKDAKPRSRRVWMKKKVRLLLNDVGAHSDEIVVELLRGLAKKQGMLFAKRSDLQLSVAQSMAIRDHVGTGTNGLYRIKQAIEFYCPALKGILLPPNIRRHISIMERDGVVPSKIVQVCCTVNKKGNKRGMNTFYYCSCPSQLLENMLVRMFLDKTFQPSFDFSSMTDTIVISGGFDKSDSDFVGTWRPCNRRNGNSAVYVQTFACLEGPVSED